MARASGLIFLAGLLFPTVPAPAAGAVNFQRDIHPILSDNCFTCHGPDEKSRMANLRLDTREGIFAERGGHRVIVPGNPAASRLYERITAAKPASRMPPPASGRSLTEQQVSLIRAWIEQGAKWEQHWAYIAPRRPEPPSVQRTDWVRNPIDQFVLARLEREGLAPSPPADKATLLRRVTFDLTGLPPTPAEADAFLADKSAAAYEKVVDRLLASPRYGERMAMQWLDLARYADTHGYHIDSHRDMWPWRDWVIAAYNRNMPYDRFTIEQLAGDLLPGATLEQKVATGFNRNHMINFEGGAIPEEYLNEYVVDRVEATSTVWMGMTMGCARCHDHKYDPIAQKDFYRFYAFFNTVAEKGLDGRKGNAEPVLQLPSAPQKARLEQLLQAIAGRQEALPEKELAERQEQWEKARLETMGEAAREGLTAHYEMDGNLADSSGGYRHGRVLVGDASYPAGTVARAADFDGQTHVTLGRAGDFEWNRPFSLSFWMRANGRLESPVITRLDPAAGRRGYEIRLSESEPIGVQKRAAFLSIRLIHRWPDSALEVRTRERLMLGTWYQIAVNYDGSGKAAGLALYLDGKPAALETERDALGGSIGTPAPLEIGNRELGQRYRGQIDDLRIYSRVLGPADIHQLAADEPVRATLLILPNKRSKDQKERLREYFLTYDAPETIRRDYAALKALRAEMERLEEAIPTSMVMAEMAKPRDTFILGRGDYRNKGEKVTPGVPSVLPPLPKDAPLNRLSLARWLVNPAHPLTARVAVNRFWQMYFGTGLVKTAEDFGSQGEAPSHPGLLDWLATEFIRTGWDVKAMQKLIVTSAMYRQSSRVTPQLHERDPDNRLLARGPRFRLPAEMVRDNALAAAGLLNEERGGRSVFPYQPKGLWEEIAYGDGFSAQTYASSHGKELYRRSMYTFWKRTSPPPSLITFDAPDREKCVARRPVTNSPLQALVLLNDPTFVEAARVLAARVLREAGGDAGRRVRLAFRLATGREPVGAEARVLRDLARRQSQQYRRNPLAAKQLLGVGESPLDAHLDPAELAAWTTVASTILNLDETITKE